MAPATESWAGLLSRYGVYAVANIELILVFVIACGLLLRLSKGVVTLDERSRAWKMELEKELADEAMEQAPIADYSKLPERIPFHTQTTDEVEEAFKQLLIDVTRELRDAVVNRGFIVTCLTLCGRC